MAPSQKLRLPNGERVCVTCGMPYPEESFGRNTDNTARLDCPKCRRAIEKEGDQKRLSRDKSRVFSELARRLRGDKINVPHTAELAASMLATYGTLEEFCREWKSEIDAAPAGSKTKLDQFYAIAKLIAESTRQRDSRPDLDGMSDEDLSNEFLGLFVECAQASPDIARVLHDALDLKVVHPDDDEEQPVVA